MSQLLTREAIEQAGTQITHKGNTVVPGSGTIGVSGGTNGCLITFDQSNGQIAIGDNSNNAYLQLFTTSGDTAIRDSASLNLLSFTAASSAVNNLRITNAATGDGPELAVIGSDSNASLEVIPKGTGTLHLKNSSTGASTGIDFSAGSSGTGSYILKGPQTGAQSSSTASIELPTFSSVTVGHVLKVSSSSSGTSVVTEWAADSGGLTYNAITSGTSQTAAADQIYALLDASRSGVFTLTLPSSMTAGSIVQIVDGAGIAGTSSTKVTITSSQNINGSSSDFDLQADFGNVKLLCVSVSGVPAYVVI